MHVVNRKVVRVILVHRCKLSNPFGIQPTNLLEDCPEFASFVNINLAGLLGVSLSEFFVDFQTLDSFDEDSAFGSEVGCAVESEITSEEKFIGVEKMGLRIGSEINWCTLRSISATILQYFQVF